MEKMKREDYYKLPKRHDPNGIIILATEPDKTIICRADTEIVKDNISFVFKCQTTKSETDIYPEIRMELVLCELID